MAKKRILIALAALLIVAAALLHVWNARYYLRIVPRPLSAFAFLSERFGDAIYTPPPDRAFTKTLPLFDFSTADGRRDALFYVRRLVPPKALPMNYENLNMASWFARLKVRHGFCTDFSLLMISLADRSGLRAREWILWHDDNWAIGSAHSIAEIRLADGRWIAFDGQHATLLVRANGSDVPVSMTEALSRAADGKPVGTLRFSVAEEVGLPPAASTASALARLPSGAMLNLHLGSWTGAVYRPVLAIPILYGPMSIDRRIWTSKAAVFIAATAGLFGVAALMRRRSRRALRQSSGRPPSWSR